MHVRDFSYHLPPARIAQKPASPRDSCRLMVLNRKEQSIQDLHFYDLEKLLKPGDVLILNNSKVIPARLQFRHNNKRVEIFLIQQKNTNTWFTIGKPGKSLQKGIKLNIAPQLQATVQEVLPDGQRVIEFSIRGDELDNTLKKLGQAPFPPYIKNPQASLEDYQTIYAKAQGSVAAPTAGLHFTNRLLKKLEAKGVEIEFVTLHVGLGTFLPIKTSRIENHSMHKEIFSIDPFTAKKLNQALKEKKRLIAVGTTTVRVLESSFHTYQKFQPGIQETAIYIYPGYQWQCVSGLITNFHLPESTLLLLTCSFGGEDFIKKAYKKAIKEHYRFYSFGDAMFIS